MRRRSHQTGFRGLGECPRVARLKAPYVLRQLDECRDGVRESDVMAPTAKDLTGAQIEAQGQSLGSL
jgi:cytochrome c553